MWIVEYIGIPYNYGSFNKEKGLDCFGFFCYVQNNHYGLNLTYSTFSSDKVSTVVKAFRDADLSKWIDVQTPKEGDAVLMSSRKRINHVGIYVEHGHHCGILHSTQSTGSLFSYLNKKDLIGYEIKKFKRFLK